MPGIRGRWTVAAAAALAVGTAGCTGGTPAASPAVTTTVAGEATVAPPVTTSTSGSTSGSSTTTAPPPATSSTPVTPADEALPGARSVLNQAHPGWGLDRIGQHNLPLNDNFRVEATGAGVTVYTVDTGVQAKNPAFQGRVSSPVAFPHRFAGGVDEMGVDHGTFVAGIIAGARTGVARKAEVVVVQAVQGGDGEEASPEAVRRKALVDAVNWIGAHAHRPAVVNLSLNLDEPTPALDQAVRRLVEAGLPVVVSAGNQQGQDACRHSPAGVPGVITVAASNRADRPDEITNLGRCVTVFAPGQDITSISDIDPAPFVYEHVSATSWAAPFVTGAVAVYLSVHPKASPAQVKQWVIGTSTKGVLKGVPAGTPNRLLYVGTL